MARPGHGQNDENQGMKKGVRLNAAANQQRAGSALRAALAAAVRARGIRNENKVDAWNTCSVTNSRGQYSKTQGKQESRCIENHQTSMLEPSKVTDDSGQGGAFLNPISSFSSDSGICFSPNELDGGNERITDDERSSALTDGLPRVLNHFFSRKMASHYNIRRCFVFFQRWLRFVGESDLKSTYEHSTIERAKRRFRKLRVDSCFDRWFYWKQNKRAKRRTCFQLDSRHCRLLEKVAWHAWPRLINYKSNTSSQMNSVQYCHSPGVMRHDSNSFLDTPTPQQPSAVEKLFSLPPDHNQPVVNYDIVSKQILVLEEQISTEIERIENNLLSYICNVESILHLGCSNMKDRESSWGQEKAVYESR